MSVRDTLSTVLAAPSPGALWSLRADLLESGVPGGAEVWSVIGEFHRFLDHLAAGTSSRDYSHLASKMDIGAVGGVVIEHVLETRDPREIGMRLLTGLLSEGLMVLGSRQYVKGAEEELAATYRDAAWYLYDGIWRWAERQQSDLPAAERRRLIDRLFEPILAEDSTGARKALVIGQLFQVLLVSAVSAAIGEIPQEVKK